VTIAVKPSTGSAAICRTTPAVVIKAWGVLVRRASASGIRVTAFSSIIDNMVVEKVGLVVDRAQ